MGRTNWSNEEFSVVRALALQVRVITAEQMSRGWFPKSRDGIEKAESVLRRLLRAGLVERMTMEAHPLVSQERPLIAWKVGMPPPANEQLQAISEQSRKRWPQAHHPVEVYRASKLACRVFGSFVDARHIRNCEATHDLHLADLFVRLLVSKPRLAAQWLGEGAFPKLGFDVRGMKDPDAFLVDHSGVGIRVIEFSGNYEPDHLKAFHLHCAGGAARRLAGHRGLHDSAIINRLYPVEGINYQLW